MKLFTRYHELFGVPVAGVFVPSPSPCSLLAVKYLSFPPFPLNSSSLLSLRIRHSIMRSFAILSVSDRIVCLAVVEFNSRSDRSGSKSKRSRGKMTTPTCPRIISILHLCHADARRYPPVSTPLLLTLRPILSVT